MIRKLRFRPEVDDDVKSIRRWYENERKGLGDYFLLCLEAAVEAIKTNPHRFPRFDDVVRKARIKRFPYTVFFVDDENGIMVLAVYHERRNPDLLEQRIE